MDDIIIKQEFENTIKVKQELGTSGPLDNFKSECIEENNDCTNVKQETEDSSTDCDICEDSEQDVKVWIKDEVTRVKQEFETSGPLDNFKSECIEELNIDCSALKQESLDLNTDCDTCEDSEQDVKVWIKDEVTRLKQVFETSGPLDNFKSECIEELNIDCSAVKLEPLDSTTDCDTHEESKQDVKESIKSEVEIVYNDLDYSETRSYSACDEELSKENKSSPNSSQRPEYKNDLKLTDDISSKKTMLSSRAEQYNCKICDKPFVNKYYFNRHVQCHSGTDMHKCINCEKKFKHPSKLKTHLIKHSDRKPHKCELCSKEFKMSGSLKYHFLTIHSSDKKTHKCELCSKEFTKSTSLKVHLLTIHSSDKKPHKCELCSKEFTMSSSLKTHLLTLHSDKKPHKCELCSKEFKRSDSLKAHLLIHSDKKPHKCELCGKEFRMSRSLKTHLLTLHSDKKPHKCERCSKEFNRSDNL